MEKLFHAKVISAFFAGLFRWIYPFQRVWSTEAVYSCSHKHPMTTYFTIKTKCFSLSCYHLACVLSLWRHLKNVSIRYLYLSFSWWGVEGFQRMVVVCVLWVLLQEDFAAPRTLFIHRLKVFITPLQAKTNRNH